MKNPSKMGCLAGGQIAFWVKKIPSKRGYNWGDFVD